MATSTSTVPAASSRTEHPILSGSHAVDSIVGLLTIDEPLAPTLALEDISDLDQDGCLDRAIRAFDGLRSLGRLSSLQVWIAGQSLSRAKDLAKHGTWLSTLEERNLAEATVRQAIRVYKKFPNPSLLPPQITKAKIAAGIVHSRLPEVKGTGGETTEARAKSFKPDQNTSSMPVATFQASKTQSEVKSNGHIESEEMPNAKTGDKDGEPEEFARSGPEIAPRLTGPKWFDGEPSGDLGKGSVWQVLMAGEDVRVVWAPVATETDRHVLTTTAVKLAREDGIYRTRRDALLGASSLLSEDVERLKADLDDATRSLTKVLDLLGEN